MGEHSIYAPSSLERIAHCPGCIHACANLPERPAEAVTEQGAAIHEMIAEYLATNTAGDREGEAIREAIATAHPEAEAEAVELAAECVEFAERIIGQRSGSVDIETRLEVPDLYFGTADVVIDSPESITIIDWKSGYKEVTEAADNLQGKAYALAAAMKYGFKPVNVHFFMPRIHKASECTFTDIQALYDEIDSIIEASQQGNAELHAGEHCTYCPAFYFGACPQVNGIAAAEAARNEKTEELTEGELATRYETLAFLAKAFENLKAVMLERVKAAPGGKYAGYQIRSTGGGYDCKDIPAIMDEAAGLMPTAEVMQFVTLSVDKLATAYGKKGKEHGDFKSAAEGKAAFLGEVAQYLEAKPPRQTLVKIKPEGK